LNHLRRLGITQKNNLKCAMAGACLVHLVHDCWVSGGAVYLLVRGEDCDLPTPVRGFLHYAVLGSQQVRIVHATYDERT
jgi:hypothetical protein